jgi:uncharacterized protein (UPF0276 family)
MVSLSDVLEIKSLPEPDWLPPGKPRVFHWGKGLAESDFLEGLEALGPWAEKCSPRLFSCDLGPASPKRLGIVPLRPPMGKAALLRAMKNSLARIRDVWDFPALAAENYNYYPTGLYENVARPEDIGELLDKLDLGLVLDLAHAAVSAHNLGLELESYVFSLPLCRLAEIHVSAPYIPPHKKLWAADSHGRPGKREWALLGEALRKAGSLGLKPIVVAEYYGHARGALSAMAELESVLEKGGPPGAA